LILKQQSNTPVTINVVAVVEMSRAEFEASQGTFLETLASATGVDKSKVKIVSIKEISLRRGSFAFFHSDLYDMAASKTEPINKSGPEHGIGSRRKLLATGVEVTTAVETTAAQSDSMAASLSGNAVKEQMSARGFKVEVKGIEVPVF
jgi:hypothetical protein